MTLALCLHPLSSYCHKVLIALYENATPFATRDMGEAAGLWPLGKIPLLVDNGRVIPETSIIIEYLQRHYPGPVPLIPAEPELALQARHWDRFFDLYVHTPMQKIVDDKLRPEGAKDAHGVAKARAGIRQAYGMIEAQLAGKAWAIGDDFTIADCAAAPALFYASTLEPFGREHTALAAYFERLVARPSYARVLDEARPVFKYYPFHDRLDARFL